MTQTGGTGSDAMRADADQALNQTVTSGEADLEDLRARLASWLAGRPEGAGHGGDHTGGDPAGSGAGVGGGEVSRLVARMCPQDEAFPGFPVYDLGLQFDVMRVVGEHTDLPVPRARWLEEDPAVLGSPFLVMDRVSGVAPVDNPPYVFDGWLLTMS